MRLSRILIILVSVVILFSSTNFVFAEVLNIAELFYLHSLVYKAQKDSDFWIEIGLTSNQAMRPVEGGYQQFISKSYRLENLRNKLVNIIKGVEKVSDLTVAEQRLLNELVEDRAQFIQEFNSIKIITEKIPKGELTQIKRAKIFLDSVITPGISGFSTAPEIIAAEKFTAEELAKIGKFAKGAKFIGKWGGRAIIVIPVIIAGREAYYQVKDMETGEAIASWTPYTLVNFTQLSDPGQIIRDLSETIEKQNQVRQQKNITEDKAREIYLQNIRQERINRECAGFTGHDRTVCEENIKKGIRAAQTNILQQREQKRIYDARGGAMEEGIREAWGGGLLRKIFQTK